MENRFGFKDLVMMLLVVTIIVMLGLKMAQDDRQWEQLQRIGTKLDQQTRDITALRRLISEGGIEVATADGGSSAGGGPREDIFRRLRAVRQHPDYAQGDVFIDSFGSIPPKLNLLTSHDTYSRMVYTKVLEGLAEWDIEKLEMVPHLARSWEMAEDGLSLDVRLRRNVTFSDGEPMTSEDVVYTWRLQMDPEITDGQVRAYYHPIERVEALGPYEVRFRFRKLFYENFMRAMEVPVLPKHFYERYTKRQIREHTALLMGTGPYRLPDPTKYTPGQTIELVRNERYWGVPGPWEGMIWRIIESESTEQVAFRNGETDMFVPTPEQHNEMLSDSALRGRTQHFVYTHVRSGYNYIAWNQQRGGKKTVFADRRVRQAMTMLIDRQTLIDQIMLGFAVVSDGPFHPEGPQHNDEVRPWPYDPQRAIALLEEAGFRRDDRGRMLGPDGRPFEVDLSYPSGSDLIEKIALFLKDNFARAGITLRPDPQEWALLLKNMMERNFHAMMAGWGAGSIEGDIEQMFHSKNIEEGDNRNAYSNPQLDRLIERAHVTLDEEARMAVWQQCHAILHEDQPYTFMMFPKTRLWLDGRVRNVQRIPVLGINYVSTWAVPMEWYVPSSLQKRTLGNGRLAAQ